MTPLTFAYYAVIGLGLLAIITCVACIVIYALDTCRQRRQDALRRRGYTRGMERHMDEYEVYRAHMERTNNPIPLPAPAPLTLHEIIADAQSHRIEGEAA